MTRFARSMRQHITDDFMEMFKGVEQYLAGRWKCAGLTVPTLYDPGILEEGYRLQNGGHCRGAI
jgi:phytoene dehydrogenase-like protein